MNRKNQVLDALSDTYEELDRLYQMIPEDSMLDSDPSESQMELASVLVCVSTLPEM